jgi:hypothetical protein
MGRRERIEITEGTVDLACSRGISGACHWSGKKMSGIRDIGEQSNSKQREHPGAMKYGDVLNQPREARNWRVFTPLPNKIKSVFESPYLQICILGKFNYSTCVLVYKRFLGNRESFKISHKCRGKETNGRMECRKESDYNKTEDNKKEQKQCAKIVDASVIVVASVNAITGDLNAATRRKPSRLQI